MGVPVRAHVAAVNACGIEFFHELRGQGREVLQLPMDDAAFQSQGHLPDGRDGDDFRLLQAQSGLGDLVEVAAALAAAWGAEYKFYDKEQYWSLLHDCWNYAAENENLIGWLLSK